MADGGPGTPENARPPRRPEVAGPSSVGNPIRLVPARQPTRDDAGTGDVPVFVEPDDQFGSGGEFVSGPHSIGGEGLGPLFAPRSFGGGRVRVRAWGCSPGCLIVAIVGSLLLSLILGSLI